MKIICVGRNYAAHAKELNNEVPEEPIFFLKPPTALLQPGRPCYYPEFTHDLQYECELVIKISRNGKFIQERFAPKYYNAVSVGIDFTARDVQQRLKTSGLPWEISKAFDGSAAVGQFIPLTEVGEVHNLHFRLLHNDTPVQNGFSGDMIFRVNEIIARASRYFTLNTGDLIFTGTPQGVGSVQINDRLEGFLGAEKLLHTDIR